MDCLEKACGVPITNDHTLSRLVDDAEKLRDLDEVQHLPRRLDGPALLAALSHGNESGMVVGEE